MAPGQYEQKQSVTVCRVLHLRMNKIAAAAAGCITGIVEIAEDALSAYQPQANDEYFSRTAEDE